jgi:tRNA(Ile)-lysidine synthase
MLEAFLANLKREIRFRPEEKILLAVSGGLDSAVMAELFHQAGFSFAIAHCNFHLRGQESDRDEEFVRSLAAECGVRLFVEHFNTTSFARKNKLSIQVAARNLRYDWFEKVLSEEGYDYIATAHHLDDQIETFFINLSRGTGIAGLHGILPKQGRIIRPLLFATRAELEKYARENQVRSVEDSSNRSLKYTRNRIRHRIIPEFEKLNPSFREAMQETIYKIRDAEDIFNDIVAKEKKRLLALAETGWKIEIAELMKLSPARTWLYALLSDFDFTPAVVGDILSSLEEQPGKLFHSPTHRLVKDRDFLLISPHLEADPDSRFEVYPDSVEDLPVRLEFQMIPGKPSDLRTGSETIFLDHDKLQLPLTIRRWREGDHFIPFGMKHRKKLSNFFIDMKFSLIQKENTWLLCSGEDIVWIVGVRPDERFKVTDETKRVLQVRLVR